mgnify:CR=1 FL=1
MDDYEKNLRTKVFIFVPEGLTRFLAEQDVAVVTYDDILGRSNGLNGADPQWGECAFVYVQKDAPEDVHRVAERLTTSNYSKIIYCYTQD